MCISENTHLHASLVSDVEGICRSNREKAALQYSIIIPHKDIPDLLQRCLDSIPLRDDVQVIVVDDNSDPKKVDFDHFPRWKGKRYEYYLTKEGKGAGYARNVGLDHAKGRWVVFADADDFFADGFNALLDEMVDAKEDLIFFDYINVCSDDITQHVNERMWFSNSMKSYREGTKNEKRFRTSIPVAWCRLVKRELLEKEHIRFSETRWSNDVFFSAQVNCMAKKFQVNSTVGYVLTQRTDSLTDRVCGTSQELIVRLQEGLKGERLYAQHGLYAKGTLTSPHLRTAHKKKGFWWCLRFAVTNVFNWPIARLMFAYLYKRTMKK